MNKKDGKVASSSGSPMAMNEKQPAETKSQIAGFATSAAGIISQKVDEWFRYLIATDNLSHYQGNCGCYMCDEIRAGFAPWRAAQPRKSAAEVGELGACATARFMKKKTKAASKAQRRAGGSLDALVRGCKRHLLKAWPEYFEKIVDGTKTFEVRKDDRDFQVGDELEIYLWGNGCQGPKGQPSVVRRVTYILRDFPGLASGYCAMALESPNSGDKP